MDKAVRIKYDAQVDILRIRLGDTAIEESAEIEPGVIVDYDETGNIVGLEILDASDIVQNPKTAAIAEQK
ncbi:MAG: DUF2283 domain-containing protein [Anaerolineae bacterium]|nr:DUF2283 domain-containing protein [Anaerolineae bacterium]